MRARLVVTICVALVVALSTGGASRASLPGGYTEVVGDFIGFDKCVAPSTATMSNWWANSPYFYYGVYIGGINRACSNGNLSASWVTTVANFKSAIGSLTGLLLLTVYLFVSAAIFLVGAEVDELLRKETQGRGLALSDLFRR